MPPRRIGLLLLAAWLILTGLLPLLGVTMAGAGLLLDLLALAAGVMLIWRPLSLRDEGDVGFLLLGLWLILMGLMGLLALSFRYSDLILNLLAVAAGVLLLLEARE